MWENNLVSSVFKEDVQMFCQTKTENNDQYKDGMRWEVQDVMQLSKHDLHCLWGHNTKKSPPKAVLCNLGNSERETQMSCVQRWKQTTMTVPFLNAARTRECEREGKDETMSNFLASSGQIWPRSHQPLSCLRRCWQSAKCVWRWLRLVHIQQLARRDTQKKGW